MAICVIKSVAWLGLDVVLAPSHVDHAFFPRCSNAAPLLLEKCRPLAQEEYVEHRFGIEPGIVCVFGEKPVDFRRDLWLRPCNFLRRVGFKAVIAKHDVDTGKVSLDWWL